MYIIDMIVESYKNYKLRFIIITYNTLTVLIAYVSLMSGAISLPCHLNCNVTAEVGKKENNSRTECVPLPWMFLDESVSWQCIEISKSGPIKRELKARDIAYGYYNFIPLAFIRSLRTAELPLVPKDSSSSCSNSHNFAFQLRTQA